MTFAVITPPTSGSAVEIVNLYRYSLDNTFTQWTEAQAITNKYWTRLAPSGLNLLFILPTKSRSHVDKERLF